MELDSLSVIKPGISTWSGPQPYPHQANKYFANFFHHQGLILMLNLRYFKSKEQSDNFSLEWEVGIVLFGCVTITFA